MKYKLKDRDFNTYIEASDWRYSATIVGIVKYFEYYDRSLNLQWDKVEDGIYFNEEDITEERFLEFIEEYFKSDMHHKIVLDMLSCNEYSEEQIKVINDKLKAKISNEIKFNGSNKDEVLNLINKNKYLLTKETFRNKYNLYKNYCNTNSLFEEEGQCCRLAGYYVDMGKKSKSISFNFNKGNYVYEDIKEFDFIPLAFSYGRQGIFINANSSVDSLVKKNSTFQTVVESVLNEEDDSRKVFFNRIIETDQFINFDVEVITKNVNDDFFETLYIRNQAIKKLREISKFYKIFLTRKKINDTYWINVYDEVINCILNDVRTDKLIEIFLKENEREALVGALISTNIIIKNGGKEMEKRNQIAYAAAKSLVKNLPENKLNSYKQKLTSALVSRDYERYCDILTNISCYVNQSFEDEFKFDFAFDLFEDFEGNKDVAYTFLNALSKKNGKKGEKDE